MKFVRLPVSHARYYDVGDTLFVAGYPERVVWKLDDESVTLVENTKFWRWLAKKKWRLSIWWRGVKIALGVTK